MSQRPTPAEAQRDLRELIAEAIAKQQAGEIASVVAYVTANLDPAARADVERQDAIATELIASAGTGVAIPLTDAQLDEIAVRVALRLSPALVLALSPAPAEGATDGAE